MNQEEAFDGTEEEKLRRENELLRMKLQAELGAHFGGMRGSPLPPEIEKQFLEQVMAFHQHTVENPPVALRVQLGNPDFKPSAVLVAEELEAAWETLSRQLEEKGVRVDFLAKYPLALRYDFIIGELFDYETELPDVEGQFVCFIYEDFHQNHDSDIRKRTEEFMEGFFGGRFPEKAGWYLADEMTTELGVAISREELHSLLYRFHGIFSSIREYEYHIEATSVQPDEDIKDDMPRLGFSEGVVRYTAILTDGQEQELTGPFRIYLQCMYDWWEIFFFRIHGFSWTKAA